VSPRELERLELVEVEQPDRDEGLTEGRVVGRITARGEGVEVRPGQHPQLDGQLAER